MKKIPIGAHIMIPCVAKPGPFSEEKMVAITAGGLNWFGFVKDDVLEECNGKWFITGSVVGTKSGNLLVRIPGSSPTGNVVEAPRSHIADDPCEKRAS